MSDATLVIGPLQTQWKKPYRGRQDISPPAVDQRSHRRPSAKKKISQPSLADVHEDSEKLDSMLEPDQELPDWVQKKLAIARMHIRDVKDYVEKQLATHHEGHEVAEDGLEDEFFTLVEDGVRFSGG